MLKLLLRNATTSPGKVLAVCLVLYLASMSFFVGIFVAVLAVRFFIQTMKKKAKELEAADAEAARSEAARPVVPAAPVAAAMPEESVSPAPVRQYAKSAVVIPFRTGTR
ncbi:hypothetical protein QYH69_24275 [Paraburkholderia sp. SARCC-3016]|uniref:hypothetical protein n=1 Tax=Paraburkholderia sp. SARCC-3016 TaxID=3058611 RepID=UPI0028068950|nr:hypothetical protein [Paraburkholderia sp. SARCC-3016]MDQ7980359.1 hypothetical protein [Paraburkholderia sp. SARCC-3016]